MVSGKALRNWSVRPQNQTVGPGALQGAIPLRQHRDVRPWSQELRSFALSLDGPIQGLAANQPSGLVSQPAPRTKQRWRERTVALGHSQAFRLTGNRGPQVLVGVELALLVSRVKCCPDATGLRKIVSLCDSHGQFQNPPGFCDESQMT